MCLLDFSYNWSTQVLFLSVFVLVRLVLVRHNKEQSKPPISLFMMENWVASRCHKVTKTPQQTLKLMHVYHYLIDLSEDTL